MTCREFLARHSEYVDERMDALEAARWRRHVEECSSCARYDDVVRRGGELVRELPRVEPSEEFRPRFRHRLFHVKDDMAARRRRSGPGPTALLALAVVAAVASWGALTQSAGPAPGSASADTLRTPPAEHAVATHAGEDAGESSLGLGRRAWRRSLVDSGFARARRRARFPAVEPEISLLGSPRPRLTSSLATPAVSPAVYDPLATVRLDRWPAGMLLAHE